MTENYGDYRNGKMRNTPDEGLRQKGILSQQPRHGAAEILPIKHGGAAIIAMFGG